MFPGAGQGFLAGLRGALSEAGVACTIIPEPVGACAVKDQVIDRIQRLMLQHEPHVITGIMGTGLLRHSHTLFIDSRTPFLVNDLGGDPLITGGARNPFVFSNSLNLWQSMFALGFWAAAHVGRRAAVATAFHEAGYGMINAFCLGFNAAGGSDMLATEVTHTVTSGDDPSDAIRRLGACDPDFVVAFYSGREGVSFTNAWCGVGLAGRIPLLTTPLMTHNFWRPGMPADAVDGMRTACCWDIAAESGVLERFRRAAGVETMSEPAVFTLLGYETGLMLAAAVERAGQEPARGDGWREALDGVSIASPRGELSFDPEIGVVRTVDWLQQWRSAEGATFPTTLGALPLPASFRDAYNEANRLDVRSGWFNPYLVT